MATSSMNHNMSVNSAPSIANRLDQAKKDFPAPKLDRVKNFSFDLGAAYAFPENHVITDLPAGIYYPSYSRNQDFLLSKASLNNDLSNPTSGEVLSDLEIALGETEDDSEMYYKIQQAVDKNRHHYLGDGYFPLHLYNDGLQNVHEGIIQFLNSKSFYSKTNLGFKRSVLLYGPTGSGKSRYMDWLSKELIEELHAIVIRVSSHNELDRLNEHGLLTINRMLSSRLIVILIEELSALVGSRNGHLSLLNCLDSPLLRENVLFLITTNNPDRIPDNIISRHQRLDVLAEISPQSNKKGLKEAFYEFVFQEPMEAKYKASDWFNKPMTPAALKELFVYAKLNEVDLDQSYQEIKTREKKIRENFRVTEPLGFLG